MKKLLTIVLFTFLLLFTGCNKDKSTENNSQIANPASEYCIEHDGKLKIRSGDKGEYGVCMFQDGSECEEWEYFRGECKKGEKEGLRIFPNIKCDKFGGIWLSEHNECENIGKEECESISGNYNECASACRHTNAEICTMQCVAVCQFD